MIVFSFTKIQRQAAAITVLRPFGRKTVSLYLYFPSQAKLAAFARRRGL
jgi:hypothetical protein